MNRVLNIYADADAFFDYRRALIQCMMTEGIEDLNTRKYEGDKLWEMHVEDNYKKRRLDTFNYPQFGIDEDRFKAMFQQRSLEHWATGMYYPSKLITQLLSKVIDIEGLSDKPIDIKEVVLYVNTWPYDFGEELTANLLAAISHGLKGIVKVKEIHSDPFKQGAQFYGQYNYVFRYNLLTDESCELLTETFKDHPIPETAFIVPDILARETTTFAGPPKDWMNASFIMLAPSLKLLPTDHSLYDYDV